MASPADKWILIVDDDPDICDIMRLVLDLQGYTAIAASDGGEALAILRRGEYPCLILLDLMMPGMDGYRFRQEQVADPTLAAIPVVVLSGGHDTAGKAAALGVMGMEKPIDLDVLLDIVRRYCRPA